MDIYCIDMATNHLSTWCDALTGFDKAENTKRGKDYRAIYNHVDKRLRKDITGRYGGAGYIVYKLTIHCDEALSLTTQIIAQMKQVAAVLSVTVTGGYIALNAKRANISTFQLRNEFNGRYSSIGISRTRVLLCDKYEAKVIESLYRVVPSVSDIIHRYEQGVIMLVDNMRKIKMKDSIDITNNELDTINTLPEKSLLVIKEVYALLISLISVYRVRANAINVTSEIEIEQARLINEPVTPKINNRQESIGDAIKAELLPEYTWG